jgi:hypothetical protein
MNLTETIQWRPVSEKPDDATGVLVVWGGKVTVGYYLPGSDRFYFRSGGVMDGVTHWAPLPKGPTE